MIDCAILHRRGNGRADLVAAMLRQIPHARVVVDEDGSGEARFMDRRGCWPIARRAWAEPLISSHRLVLEDDAILCAGFADRLQQVVELAPAAVVSLFRGARQCSVATVMPNAFIPRWLDWAGRASRARPHHDQLIALGCLAIGVPHLYASPSLVEHAAVPSLLDHPPVAALRFDPSPTTVVLES